MSHPGRIHAARVNVSLRPSDRVLLNRLADERDVSLGQVARDAIRHYVPRELAKLATDRAADRDNPAAWHPNPCSVP